MRPRILPPTSLVHERPCGRERRHGRPRDFFFQSIELARSQGALAWELHFSMSLARLRRDQELGRRTICCGPSIAASVTVTGLAAKDLRQRSQTPLSLHDNSRCFAGPRCEARALSLPTLSVPPPKPGIISWQQSPSRIDPRCEKDMIVATCSCPQEHNPVRWRSYANPVNHWASELVDRSKQRGRPR
jgi:hypothetical protein